MTLTVESPPRMRPVSHRFIRALGVGIALMAGVTCGDQSPTTPRKPLAPGHSRFSVDPVHQVAPAGAPRIPLSKARGVLVGEHGDSVVAEAKFDGDSAVLTFEVQITGNSADYTLDLTEFDTQGLIAFHGQQKYTLKPGDNPKLPQPVLTYAAPDAALSVMHVAPATLVLDAGASGGVGVTGSNSAGQPVSPIRVAWTSSNAAVATVDANGAVHAGQFQGTAYIVGRSFTGLADSSLVRVHAPVDRVVAAPAALELVRGLSGAAAAELRDAGNHLIDDRSATWSTSDASVATVSSFGVVQAIKIGTATITASAEGKSATVAVKVVSPVDHVDFGAAGLTFASLHEVQTVVARPVARPGASVAGLAVTYESSNPAVASVTSGGVVTANANGTATITATVDGITGTATVVVKQVAASVSVSPKSAGVQALGDSRSFSAVVLDALGSPLPPKAVTWSSSDAAVASVSNEGIAVGRGRGTATITATVDGKSDAAEFTVSQIPRLLFVNIDRSQVRVGESAHLTATTADANGNLVGTASPIWTTSTPGIISIGGSTVTGLAVGVGQIAGTLGGLTGTLTLSIAANPALGGAITGTIINAGTGAPIAGAVVASQAGQTATSAADGSFSLTGVASGSGFTITAAGFTTTQYFNALTGSSPLSVGTLPLVPQSTLNGNFSGRIVDAVTGLSVPNAAISVRLGINATSGAVQFQTTSDQSGRYSGSLPAGTYTVTATAPGYAVSTGTVPAIGGVTISNQNIVLSPAGLSGSQYRIILQWDESPRDLDSHLTGPRAGGGTFEVAYYSQIYEENGSVVASLDQDITSGLGPETITLSQTRAGQYRYSVHLYCCGTSFGNARVTVFRGSQVAAQFTVPNQRGSVWTVFEINGSTGGITSINSVDSGFSTAAAIRRTRSGELQADNAAKALVERVGEHPKSPTPVTKTP